MADGFEGLGNKAHITRPEGIGHADGDGIDLRKVGEVKSVRSASVTGIGCAPVEEIEIHHRITGTTEEGRDSPAGIPWLALHPERHSGGNRRHSLARWRRGNFQSQPGEAAQIDRLRQFQHGPLRLMSIDPVRRGKGVEAQSGLLLFQIQGAYRKKSPASGTQPVKSPGTCNFPLQLKHGVRAAFHCPPGPCDLLPGGLGFVGAPGRDAGVGIRSVAEGFFLNLEIERDGQVEGAFLLLLRQLDSDGKDRPALQVAAIELEGIRGIIPEGSAEADAIDSHILQVGLGSCEIGLPVANR